MLSSYVLLIVLLYSTCFCILHSIHYTIWSKTLLVLIGCTECFEGFKLLFYEESNYVLGKVRITLSVLGESQGLYLQENI